MSAITSALWRSHFTNGDAVFLKKFQKIHSKYILLILFLISVATVVMAYIMENYFGIHGCQMCHYERDIFIGTGIISLICLIFLSERLQYYAIIIIGFIFLCGAFFAAYHVAVQQHLTSMPFFCPPNFSAFNLDKQTPTTFFVRCDQVTWQLFGLSLAAYNAITSICLAIFCWLWGYKRNF